MNTLADLVARLDELDEDASIYAAPRWRPSSPATVEAEPLDGSVPGRAGGMTFLVAVDTARRILRQRALWQPGRPLSLADKCEAIIYYAIYDEVQPPPSIYGEGRTSAA